MGLEESLIMNWFIDVSNASRISMLMEALVACHALAFDACYSCKFHRSLRWGGGARLLWRDLICTNCGEVSIPN